MSDWLLSHEPLLRLAVLLSGLLGLGLLERCWPERQRLPYWPRWAQNLGLALVATLALRLAVPVAALDIALWADQSGFGLLRWFEIPNLIALPLCIVLLDAAIYAQHRAMHRFRWLWRIHRVHHSDTGFDVSLALRFHPFEIVLSMLYKLSVIAVLGAAPLAVIGYESALLGFALWTHANLALPAGLDRCLRWLIVTPEMHRVHHSVERAETDSNYGNILSLWDRLFASYVAAPRQPSKQMPIGLGEFREPGAQRLTALLEQPFR
ncbi:MAG: sterol desaturase family protein [Lysobacterales bacterium]